MIKVLLATIMMLTIGFCNAAIHVRNIQMTIGWTSHDSLDIDSNGTTDFYFKSGSDNGEVDASNVLNKVLPFSYQYGQAIDTCCYRGYLWLWQTSVFGPLLPFEDKKSFLMVKFLINGNIHHGWIHLDIDAPSMKVLECAYNDTPDETVFPGEGMPLSIGQIALQQQPSFSLHKGRFVVSGLKDAQLVQVVVIDMKGSLILSKSIRGNESFELNLPSGVYAVKYFDRQTSEVLLSAKVSF